MVILSRLNNLCQYRYIVFSQNFEKPVVDMELRKKIMVPILSHLYFLVYLAITRQNFDLQIWKAIFKSVSSILNDHFRIFQNCSHCNLGFLIFSFFQNYLWAQKSIKLIIYIWGFWGHFFYCEFHMNYCKFYDMDDNWCHWVKIRQNKRVLPIFAKDSNVRERKKIFLSKSTQTKLN